MLDTLPDNGASGIENLFHAADVAIKSAFMLLLLTDCIHRREAYPAVIKKQLRESGVAESVFQRVSRILNGRIEDVVDRMERSGSDVVMREAIREVERAIDQVRTDHEGASTRRLQAGRQQRLLAAKVSELTEKARFAVAEDRDDLAAAALARQVELEGQSAALATVAGQAGEDEAKLGDIVVALKARKREMEEARAAFAAMQPGEVPSQPAAPSAQREIERRVERAEQAFDRAMGTGVAFARADADAVARVAEIDVMQKRSIVAARLSDLKQSINPL